MDKEKFKEKYKIRYKKRKEYWQSKDNKRKRRFYNLKEKELLNPYAVDYHMKTKDFLYIATSIMLPIKFLVLSNMLTEAQELIELGGMYIKKAIEYEDRNTGMGYRLSPEQAECTRKYFQYEYKWLKNAEEDMGLLEDVYNLDLSFVEEDKKKKKYRKLAEDRRDLIYTSLRLGEFNTAKKYVWEWAKKKPTSNRIKSNLDVIYNEKDFMILIIAYLADQEKNTELYPKILNCFNKFFEEKYHEPFIIDECYSTIEDQINIAYLKYKYFSEEDVELDPIEVIQSLRYGYRYKYKKMIKE